MRCRVCGTEATEFPCPHCGFDASQDRELYPTLQNDGRQLSSASLHRSNWEGYAPQQPRGKASRRVLPLLLVLLLGLAGILLYLFHPQWFPFWKYTRSEDGLYWAVEDGVLTIRGKGAMSPYNYGQSPWYDFRSEVKTVVIEDGVTAIGQWAFSDFDLVAQVQLPDSLTEIGAYAFRNCSLLEKVSLSRDLTTIGDGAFMDCSSITDISFSSKVTSIGDSAFSNCSSLLIARLPYSIRDIGASAFSDCTSLAVVLLPSGLERLKSSTFSNCISLKAVHFPDNLSVIGPYAFSCCYSLSSLQFPSSLKQLCYHAFFECSILEVYYLGTEEQWSALQIDYGNEAISDAMIHYSSA